MKKSLLLITMFLQALPALSMDDDAKIKAAYKVWVTNKTAYKKNISQLNFLKKQANWKDKGPDNPLAQYYLGVLYQKGWGVDKDTNTAIEYFYSAAENKEAVALKELKEFDAKNNHLAQYYLGV